MKKRLKDSIEELKTLDKNTRKLRAFLRSVLKLEKLYITNHIKEYSIDEKPLPRKNQKWKKPKSERTYSAKGKKWDEERKINFKNKLRATLEKRKAKS